MDKLNINSTPSSVKNGRGERLLVINPGSTSTKIAVYENETPLLVRNIRHTVEELSAFPRVIDQFEFRKSLVLRELDISIEVYIISNKIFCSSLIIFSSLLHLKYFYFLYLSIMKHFCQFFYCIYVSYSS